jgi:hypothetical protein
VYTPGDGVAASDATAVSDSVQLRVMRPMQDRYVVQLSFKASGYVAQTGWQQTPYIVQPTNW